ncbi:MAG: hypothetical protein ACTSQA_04505 [Candidatus Heimdallarchaeaceae archaeon]
MTKDLITGNEITDITLQVEKLIDKDNVFMQIATRGADPNAKDLIDFKTFDEEKLALVASRMPEINRATRAFGKQNSQATGKLMSLHMIAQSPYRRIKQCLAKIERKRSALKENIFKLRKNKVKLDRYLYKKQQLIIKMEKVANAELEGDEIMLDFELQDLDIRIQKLAADVSDSNIYIEGALKEIGMYQESYEEIRESYNISEKWDELHMEEAEIEEHVKTAFLHAVRDIEMTGKINVGTHEYLEQYGINPNTAFALVRGYLNEASSRGSGTEVVSIELLYNFLDKMHEMFKNEYKKAMKRLGLKTLISKDFLYLEDSNDAEKK